MLKISKQASVLSYAKLYGSIVNRLTCINVSGNNKQIRHVKGNLIREHSFESKDGSRVCHYYLFTDWVNAIPNMVIEALIDIRLSSTIPLQTFHACDCV